MLYNSTQNAKEVVSAAQAIAQGISKDGGLFVPQEFPKYDENTFKALLKTDYKGRAKRVFSDFLSDFTEEEISDCVEKAYTAQKLGGENPAPISYCNLDGTTLNILELWHGPTCAFKDMALQILPHLLLIDHIAGSLQLINLHWLSRPLPVQDLRRLSMEVPIYSVLPYMDPDQILPH